MWLSPTIFLIRWLFSNERVSKNNHLIGELPKTIASHDSFQSPIYTSKAESARVAALRERSWKQWSLLLLLLLLLSLLFVVCLLLLLVILLLLLLFLFLFLFLLLSSLSLLAVPDPWGLPNWPSRRKPQFHPPCTWLSRCIRLLPETREGRIRSQGGEGRRKREEGRGGE